MSEVKVEDIKLEKKIKEQYNPEIEWNHALENTVKYIGESSQSYKLMHLESSYVYNKLYQIFMYSAIIISPIAGTISAINLSIGNDTYNSFIFFGIIISILSYVSGILSAIVKFAKFNEKRDAHKVAASKYSSLENNVRRQLSLIKIDREKAKPYLQYVSKSMDELFEASPYVSTTIYEKYCLNDKEKILPLKYNKFVDIEKGYKEQTIENLVSNEEISINENNSYNKYNNVKKEYIHRNNNSFTPIPELNKFSDAHMKFELQRFIGF